MRVGRSRKDELGKLLNQTFFTLRPEACNFTEKEILAQIFSTEFCEIYKNTYFEEQLQTDASGPWRNLLVSDRVTSCLKQKFALLLNRLVIMSRFFL